ncbi:MAG: MerR family DNA-binding transcriptional regulator, partial [Anaerolineales bacterium]|nr:MerR family DNA-binding transcriptional regulator [Anaerolineales bacterium]
MQMKTFAQRTKLSPKTIRYYEEIGLLPPPTRLDNGYRDYNETDVVRAR